MRMKIPWTRLVAEFSVIVLGVTAALVADEWREARQERALERLYNARLSSDLTRDVELTRRTVRTGEEVMDRLNRVLFTLDDPYIASPVPRGGEAVVPYDVLQKTDSIGVDLSRALNGLRRFSHSRSTYDELIATGNIRVLSDHSLREAIAEYYGQAPRLEDSALNALDGARAAVPERLHEHNLTPWDLRVAPDAEEVLRGIENLTALIRDYRAAVSFHMMLAELVEESALDLQKRIDAARGMTN